MNSTPLSPQIQPLKLHNDSSQSNFRKNIRPNSLSERTYAQHQSIKDFSQQKQQMNHTSQLHTNNKLDLLQKRKLYAESIRKKNRCLAEQQKSKQKKALNTQTLNISTSFTPPKDFTNDNHQSQCIISTVKRTQQKQHLTEIQKEYYSLKKFEDLGESTNNKVFGEARINNSNNKILIDFPNDKCKIESFKSSQIFKNTSVDLGITHREGNHSARKSTNNKENKPQAIHPVSGRKNISQKYNSYAQIFDKKATMNAVINSQKTKAANNSVSRQMSSIKKDKSALKSMAEQLNLDFTSQQLSTQLDTFVNSFALEDLNDEIDFCENVIKNKPIETKIQKIDERKVGQIQPQYDVTITQTKKIQLQIISQTISQAINLSEQYDKIRRQEEKQIMTLAKQNATFKRELANFRKQNSTLQKELKNSKDYIVELQLKARTLLQQQNQFLNQQKFISQQPSNQPIPQNLSSRQDTPVLSSYQQKSTSFSYPIDNNLEQILISTEQQLFNLKSTNKALQLKVYMLEKKITHEEQLNKKRLATQVNNWRDKYNKLRNQHIRLKSSYHNSFLHSDMSISMDISRDQ